MIKIFATDKVKELDQYTIQHEPISSIDLVERAATTFVHEFCRRYSKQVRIVIFAGQGNNGADALAIAICHAHTAPSRLNKELLEMR